MSENKHISFMSYLRDFFAKETIVVDSPPGITRASMLSSSLTLRTSMASTWQLARASMCSRKSPCNARTPTRKFFATNRVQRVDVALEDLQR